MELFVSDINGKIYGISAREDSTVEYLCHQMSIILNLDPSVGGKLTLSTGKGLDEKKTLKALGVKDNDQLLFISSPPKSGAKHTRLLASERPKPHFLPSAPTKDTIAKCTTGIPSSGKERSGFAGGIFALLNDMSFHRRMRGALISLVNVACKLQSLEDGDESSESENEESNQDPSFDQDALHQLTEMGFSDGQAKKALLLNSMSCLQAMEWLIQHQGDADIDESFPTVTTTTETATTKPANRCTIASDNNSSDSSSSVVVVAEEDHVSTLLFDESSSKPVGADVLQTTDLTVSTPISQTVGADGTTNSAGLPSSSPSRHMDAILADASGHGDMMAASPKKKKHLRKRKWEFTPDRAAIYKLKQMGFKEDEVVDALRVCNNNESAACEWLLGERIPGTDSVDTGLAKDSEEYKDIFKEPTVHLGLMSSRNLKILEDIIQEQPLLTQYLSDPELGPLLLHVARIVLDKPSGVGNVVG